MKKYSVCYACGTTHYGWSMEFDRLDEFENDVNECRRRNEVAFRVWDNELKKFIFYKRCGEDSSVDMLGDVLRDMRTSDRTIKRH